MDLKKFFILFLFFAVQIYPQKDSLRTYQTSDVVITATRTEVPISELANSISIIDSSEIAERHTNSIFDLLKEEYGLSFTQQGGPGKLAYVNMRGGDPGNTLVLIDGVEMNMPNDPSNTYDFSYLTPDNVNRIEVLRGPQSTLYGSDASSGVINIITRKGAGTPSWSLSTEGGSYGTYKGTAGLNGSVNIFNYSITASKFNTQGFSSADVKYGNTERDPSLFYNVSSRLGADINPELKLALITRYSSGTSSYDQFGGAFGDDPTYVFDFQELANRLEASASLFDGFWKSSGGISFMRNIRKYSFDPSVNFTDSSRSHYDGLRMKLDYLNNFQLSNSNLLTLGYELSKEGATSEYYSKFFNSLFDNHTAVTQGLFLQEQININQELFATAGVRYDHHNKFGSVFTYRIAPAYFLKETGTKLKFTIGNAFKAPSLFYLFDPQYGNPDLKPEKTFGWDAGIEQYISNSNISVGATYFRSKFIDLFGFNEAFQTININRAQSYGVELYSTLRIGSMAEIKLNYTYNKTKELEGTDKNAALIRRPENKFSFIASCEILPRLTSVLEFLYVGNRTDKDFSAFPSVTIVLPSYTITNLSASYRIWEMFEIYGRFENIFDTQYEEILGYGTARRSGYAGIRLNF